MMKSIFTTTLCTAFVIAAISLTSIQEVKAFQPEMKITSEEYSTELKEDNTVRRPLAILRRFRPDVFVSDGNGSWKEPGQAEQLFPNDTLRTGDEGYAVVQFMDNSVAKMSPNSVLIVAGEITSGGTTAARLAMELGEVFLEVSGRNSDFELATPTAVAAVKGTVFSCGALLESTTCTVFSGSIGFRAADGQEFDLGPNQQGTADKDGNVTTKEISEDEAKRMMGEVEERDKSLEEQSAKTRTIRLNFVNDDGETINIRVRVRDSQDN